MSGHRKFQKMYIHLLQRKAFIATLQVIILSETNPEATKKKKKEEHKDLLLLLKVARNIKNPVDCKGGGGGGGGIVFLVVEDSIRVYATIKQGT